MYALIAAAFPGVVTLSERPVGLSAGNASWSMQADFDGPAALALSLRHGPLDRGSSLRIRVDGRVHAEVPLDGTGVPSSVPLGPLRGAHTVTLESRLREPGRSACEPGEPWMTIDPDSTLSGVVTSARPARLASELRGRAVDVSGDDPVLLLEARGVLESWGARVERGGTPVVVREGDRRVSRSEDGIVVQGDGPFIRALRSPQTLGRCSAWPCVYGPGDIDLPRTDGTTLQGLGFPKGLTLTGREERDVVFRLPGPLQSGTLRLDLSRTGAELDDASHLTIVVDEQPVGTWAMAPLEQQQVLSVELPEWVVDRRFLRIGLRVDLQGDTEVCGREAGAPWVRLGPRSGIDGEPARPEGLTRDAQRIAELGTARICLDTAMDDALATVIGDLRPNGGWRLDCDTPDVAISTGRPEGYDGVGSWWSTGPDLVAASDERWVVRSGWPLRIHRPMSGSMPHPLPWLRLEGDEVVSTPDGWSARRGPGPAAVLDVEGRTTDGERHRALLDLVFAMLVFATALLGLFWAWRSRGSTDQWMEQVDQECSSVVQVEQNS